jgi:hypothetical protein
MCAASVCDGEPWHLSGSGQGPEPCSIDVALLGCSRVAAGSVLCMPCTSGQHCTTLESFLRGELLTRADGCASCLLPTQVQRVARAISSNGVPFRSFVMTGGEEDEKERNKKVRGGGSSGAWAGMDPAADHVTGNNT